MLNIAFVLVLSYLLVFYAIPSIIRIAYLKHLFDDPALEERKIHKSRIPNLGGIAVLTCFAFSACLFIRGEALPYANYIFAAGLLIFSMGCMDDLTGLNPYKKFLAQFITAFIVVYYGDIRLSNFDGLLGINAIDPILSYAFSMLLVVFIVNAFNLIDGINGLLGTVSFTASIALSVLFYKMGQTGLSLLGFSLAGAVLGFLKYNMGKHARIFMGDAGAYTIGLVISVLTIKFMELNIASEPTPGDNGEIFVVYSPPAIAIAILIIPVFDTLRVFILRIAAGRSPFIADRKHLHHRLLDIGMSHTQATVILGGVNVFMIAMAIAFQKLGNAELLLLIGILTFVLNALLWLYDVKTDKAHLDIQPGDSLPEIPVSANEIIGHAKQVAEEALQQNKN